jgi:hypothetical protein
MSCPCIEPLQPDDFQFGNWKVLQTFTNAVIALAERLSLGCHKGIGLSPLANVGVEQAAALTKIPAAGLGLGL